MRARRRITAKGDATRERIVDEAIRRARIEGLGGLTIGELAGELGLSKSGLIAHFGDKEGLLRAVLEKSIDRFHRAVLEPALESPAGEPRLRVLFERWLAWLDAPEEPGGCVLMVASTEFEDRPGPLRELVAASQQQLVRTLSQVAALAVDVGHFHVGLDTDQFAFEWQSIASGYHHWRRLLRDPLADRRARDAFERLVRAARA